MSSNQEQGYAKLMQMASEKIAKLEAELDAVKSKDKSEPIAIIGMSCRFPGGASTPEAFWELLQNGVDTITEVPPDRWNLDDYYDSDPTIPGKIYTRYGAFVEKIQEFDASFFGISPKEAINLDPQHRLLLEVSWEALERSATNPQKLIGTQTGVFIGMSSSDYFQNVFSQSSEQIDAYSGIGNGHSTASGRISYLLGLKGPCLAVDTACSSSLISTHLACSSLRNRECNLALAGGVHLVMSPKITISYCKAKMLSADGRCKAFDASADGFVRGEGCGMIVLKRLSDALSDKDNILAVIRGSATNQDGDSSGLTVPNGLSQQALILQALENGRVELASVSYLEAHGTGTSLGDPIEVEAVGKVFEATHSQQKPLIIGSVKTNIGHLESAAGIAGLIKVVLQLQNQKIAPSLHFNQPNPYINWEQLPVQVSTQLLPWQVNNQSRIAGVSSFSVSGTNAHVVLEEATSQVKSQKRQGQSKDFWERPLHLLTLSAETEKALEDLVSSYQNYLEIYPELALADICYTASTGRANFNHRLGVIASDPKELIEKLLDWKTHEEVVGVFSGQPDSGNQSLKIAFLFTGQGSQYVNMGRQLYKTQPTFRQALEQCNQILQPYLEVPLLEVIYPQDAQKSTSDLLDQTAYTQPALFAIEYALTKLWESWGIKPDAVMGHSVGEYVAACVAGVFSLEDGLKLIAMRGQLMQQLPSGGEMVSVMASESQVTEAIGEYSGQVTIAAINGPESIVISGESEAIASVSRKFESSGVKIKQLQVSHAFHSPLMKPMLTEFEAVAKQVTYSHPQIQLISNVTGEEVGGETTTAEYWTRHVREPVRFAQSMKTLEEQEYETFLEIGPKPILLSMGRQCVPESEGEWLPSLRPGVDEWQQMLSSLGQLYVRGAKINWLGFEKDYEHQKVVLPTYPFQRQRYWIETNNNFSPKQQLLTGQNLHLETETESIKNWLYKVEWRSQGILGRLGAPDFPIAPVEIPQKLGQTLKELVTQVDSERTGYIDKRLEELSVDYIVQTLQEMGWSYKPKERWEFDAVAQKLGIVPSHRKLLKRLLEILTEEGILKYNQQQWQVEESLEKEVKPSEKSQSLQEQYPEAGATLTLLERCATQLRGVLRGAIDPVQLVFPQGDLTTATQLYEESTVAKVMNTIVEKAITLAIEKLPKSRGIRLLEIGGGTGGTTSYILPHLNPQQTEYTFTDIGALFTTKAQEKFRNYKFIRYKTLDIEADPKNQGLEGKKYDVIIAANVLHATTSMKETLSHVRELLADGGMLVLLEATAKTRWVDLVFGLLEGWWKFSDYELRPDYPLMSRSQWKKVLRETGFTEVVTMPEVEGMAETLSGETVIVAKASPTTSEQTESRSKGWLILADKEGIGKHLASQLNSVEEVCTLVFAGEKYQQVAPEEFTINPYKVKDFEELIEKVAAKSPSLYGVVQCWSTEAGEGEGINSEKLEYLSKRGCGTSLYLVQALVKAGLSMVPRLWLVTSGSQAVPSNHPVIPGLAQSSVWGMGKVISLEHPELNCTRIDLDPTETVEGKGDALFKEIWSEDREDQVAWRGDGRYVARLVASPHQQPVAQQPDATTQKPLSFRSDASYLITGGMAGLGLLVAGWMVDKGAKHLVLLGRRSPDDATRKKITELEMAGAEVVVEKADVSDWESMIGVWKRIEESNRPLAGVIHSAGTLSDGVLQNQTWSSFEQVMAPKVQGGWYLHQLTQKQELDFFVLFSSAASLLGSPGQGNHSTANAFLDGLAHYRRTMGLPGLSIHWGAVSQVGEAAERGADVRAHQQGMGVISPTQVLESLELLMSGSDVEVGVVPIQWSQWQERVAKWNFLADWQETILEVAEPSKSDFLFKLEATPPSERRSLLVAHVRRQVAQVLGINHPESISLETGFFKLGMDSLTSVELRNKLQTSLKCSILSTLAFDYPNVNKLVDYLAQQLNLIDAQEDTELRSPNLSEEKLSELSDPSRLAEVELETSFIKAIEELENLI